MTPFRLSVAIIATAVLVASLVSRAHTVGAIAPTMSPGSVRPATPMLNPRRSEERRVGTEGA